MATVPTNNILNLSKRSYAVVAENLRLQTASATTTSTMRKEDNVGGSSSTAMLQMNENKETFWMRDSKTGHWIPDNHQNDIDVAELRKKFLPKKQN